jgi:transitional endoplasmic reticulum ATPase
MDDILNIIDGIDTKNANIITVLTTNDVDALNPAMLRPGRLDAVIEVLPPDAEAVERLLRAYGGSTIPATADVAAVAEALAGKIPAVIAEVVHRAKLAQLRRQPIGERVTRISNEALLEAADTMQRQLSLLYKTPAVVEPTLDNALLDIVRRGLNGTKESVDKIARLTSEIHGATT